MQKNVTESTGFAFRQIVPEQCTQRAKLAHYSKAAICQTHEARTPLPLHAAHQGGYRWKLKKLLRRSTPTEFSLLTDSMTAHLAALQARNQHRHPAMPRGGSAFDSCVLVALFCQSDVAAIGRLEAENAELIEKGRSLRNRGICGVFGCEVGGLRGGLPSRAARMLIAQCERATQRLYASERGTLMSGRFFGRSRRLCAAFSWPTRLRHD